jgi:formiminotetrahydrofolate cyclodeaminase
MKKHSKNSSRKWNKLYKSSTKLENELRKTSKQDSKTFWKILNRLSKKGTDKNYYWPVIWVF